MEYKKKSLDRETLDRLIKLSSMWKDEDICYGINVNCEDDFCEPLYVAVDNDEIVGYIFGHYYDQKVDSSYANTGDKCFCLDELYVLPSYRGNGVGSELFRLIEDEVKDKCMCITLNTSTKDYKSILRLYIEELGMEFRSAFLVKKV